MNPKKKLIFLILLITLSGCASKTKNIGLSPIDVSKLENIKYGSRLATINKIIDHTGLPLYKFYNNQNIYYVTFYRPSRYEQSYLFLYENNLLVSVIKTETGVKIWEDNFGTYKQSIPVQQHFSKVVSSFKKHAISINTDFITDNEFEIDPKDYIIRRDDSGDVSSQLYLIGSTWGLTLFPYFMAAGTIAKISEEPTEEIISSFIEIKSNDYYENILNKYGEVDFGTAINAVISKVGAPDNRGTKDGSSILVYNDSQTIIYGFTNNKLRWMAFDYPLKTIK